MGGSWPNNYRFQVLIVNINILDRSHRRSLNTRAFIVSRIILTYKDFNGTGYRKYDSDLIYIINILY
jgi:hypothetical protein